MLLPYNYMCYYSWSFPRPDIQTYTVTHSQSLAFFLLTGISFLITLSINAVFFCSCKFHLFSSVKTGDSRTPASHLCMERLGEGERQGQCCERMASISMKKNSRKTGETLWPRMLMKKWLNIKSAADGDEYSADEFSADDQDDTETEDTESESDCDNEEAGDDSSPHYCRVKTPSSSLSRKEAENGVLSVHRGAMRRGPMLRRGQSEMFKREYISKRDLRIVVITWNVAGRMPPPHIELDGLLEMDDPADIYVIGFQEIVPLNAGNVFGTEDTSPAATWQSLIRETLNRSRQGRCACYSAPPSPSREVTSEVSCILSGAVEIDSDRTLIDEETSFVPLNLSPSSSKEEMVDDATSEKHEGNFMKVYRCTESIGLQHHVDVKENDWLSVCSIHGGDGVPSPKSKVFAAFNGAVRKSTRYVRVASKQMVGIHISVWVRRQLRRCIHSLTVSCVGLGIMGYLGNKGSVSVSMVLHQASFCFVCTHLTSGDREGDELRRNSDVMEILKRTSFLSKRTLHSSAPRMIWEHDHIIWLGDLNYRLNLSDSEIRFLVAREDWTALLTKDQLKNEIFNGHTFKGWNEGAVTFAPTYKYEFGSNRYSGKNLKSGEKRRSPAWCDRILWYGKELRQLSYKCHESMLSDHRPVIAVFIAEVEIFSEQKFKKSLAFQSSVLNFEEVLLQAESNSLFRRPYFEDF